jgi:hypothetical protein
LRFGVCRQTKARFKCCDVKRVGGRSVPDCWRHIYDQRPREHGYDITRPTIDRFRNRRNRALLSLLIARTESVMFSMTCDSKRLVGMNPNR